MKTTVTLVIDHETMKDAEVFKDVLRKELDLIFGKGRVAMKEKEEHQ